MPRGGLDYLKVVKKLAPALEAPLAKGYVIGDLSARYDNAFSYKASIVILEDMPKGPWLRRLTDMVLQLL